MSTAPAGPRPRLHHRADGPADAPPLLLGPALGTSLAVWDLQAPGLARNHRVVRWDLPGHGGSPAGLLPAEGAGVADLARLVLELADALGIDRFACAGISLGGAVGAWLAVHHPGRIASLALVCSSARFSTPEVWHERAALVREEGTAVLVESAAKRWFTPALVGSPPAEALLHDLRAADPESYAACCDALAAFDIRSRLSDITAPTLVVAGRDDQAAPPADARDMASHIRGAALTEIPGAAHLACVEKPAPVLAALLGHLADSADSADGAEPGAAAAGPGERPGT